MGHIKINKEGNEYSVTFTKDKKRKFPTFDEVLHAVENNEMLKIPILTKAELEDTQDDKSSERGLYQPDETQYTSR